MSDTLRYILVIGLYVLIGTIIETSIARSFGIDEITTPKIFYENTKMNWAGCLFCFILIRVISPFITVIGIIIMIIYYIGYFIHWLFTVGRKDD